MKRDIKQQVEKARELQLARKKKVYSEDMRMRNFTAHLEEMSAIRKQIIDEVDKLDLSIEENNDTKTQLMVEVDKLTTDIIMCINILQARQKELNEEHELITNIRPKI